MVMPTFEELCINAIRFLAIDAVQKANSGHLGMPMGATPMAYVLWDRFLKHNPSDPKWPDRGLNRFGASAPAKVVYEKLGLTNQRLVEDALQILQKGYE